MSLSTAISNSSFTTNDNKYVDMTVSDFVEALITIKNKPFKFIVDEWDDIYEKHRYYDRTYLYPIYNFYKKYPVGSQHKVLLCGRQTEKTVLIGSLVLMQNGTYKKAGDIKLNDKIANFDPNAQKIVEGTIVWKSHVYKKECVRIKTSRGHVIEVAKTHPLRTWESWTEAGSLSVNDRVATIRRSGTFGKNKEYTQEEVSVLAYILGDGYADKRSVRFTQKPGLALDDYKQCCEAIGLYYSSKQYGKNTSFRVSHKYIPILEFVRGKNSYTKSIPSFVFSLDKDDTVLFLNRLWSTDGHVKRRKNSREYSIEYCSMSKELVQQVQSLLWKFGIPSRIRENLPSIYKRRGELDKVAYILRVEGAIGAHTFLTEIGALGKSENVPLPDLTECNSNRDTLPYDIVPMLQELCAYKPNHRDGNSFRNAGFRHTLKYAPSVKKVQQYIDFFEANDYPPDKIENLKKHIESDVLWDKIVSIEDIGVQECVDFTATPHHNYTVNGVITHNSTTICNIIIVLSAIMPGLETLCIFPRHKQLRVFAKQRFDPAVFESPGVFKHMWSTKTTWQEQMKRFTNGSMVNLNSAFKDAEGVRGNSCQLLFCDELQSLLRDALYVIEESQSHAERDEVISYKTATPLSMHNIASKEHAKTCQFEWLVKCDRCNAYNELDENVIGPKFYLCKKCGREIFPKDIKKGLWVPKKPSLLNVGWGFRIPQIMVPWKTHEELWGKLNDPEIELNSFKNESLGMPTEDGEELISEPMLRRACGKHNLMGPREVRAMIHQTPVFQGTDWGTKTSGASDRKSFTCLAVGAWVAGRFMIFYIEKFIGAKANLDMAPFYVDSTARAYKVNYSGNDWGFGAHANSDLCAIYDWERVPGAGAPDDPILIEVELCGRMSKFGKYDSESLRYRLDRNSAIDRFVHAIKTQHIVFPNENIMFNEPIKEFEFSEDFLTVYREYDHTHGTYKYDHTKPDDAFHACMLCYFAGLSWNGMLLPKDQARKKLMDKMYEQR